MKITNLFAKHHAAKKRGSAVLVVVIFLGCIALLLYANSKTLAMLKEDLKLLNAKQQIKYGQSARH